MALEAVVFQQDPFVSCLREMGEGGGEPWSGVFCHVPKTGMLFYDMESKFIDHEEGNPYLEIPNTGNYWSNGSGFSSNTSLEYSSPSSLEPIAISNTELWDTNCSMSRDNSAGYSPVVARRKRRRFRCVKNQKEVEHQRMTHINVERNRRKQMNEYLKLLRSMMPPSYSQRGDQASIVGGAINFVKQLEQLLQSLESHKTTKLDSTSLTSPFSNFFAFPQYSTYSKTHQNTKNPLINDQNNHNHAKIIVDAQNKLPIADVEVRMVESHANLKILTRKQPEQLVKMVTGLYFIGLGILHLNVTTLNHSVLYSINVKVEEECQLTSVHEIATAVYEMVGRIQEEATPFDSLCST